MQENLVIERPNADEIAREHVSLIHDATQTLVQSLEDHERAQLVLRDLRGAEKKIRDRIDPIIAQANAAHKGLTRLRQDLLRPIEQAESVISGRIMDYSRRAREKAEAESRRLAEEARKREEERQLLDAIAAEESGNKAEAEAIMAETPTVPVVTVAPAVAKVDGISTTTRWKAEVRDLRALAEYVGRNPEWISLVDPNMSSLNAIARSQRDSLSIPGVIAVRETSLSVRA